MADCVGKRCFSDGIVTRERKTERKREMENVCKTRAVAAEKNEAGGGSALCVGGGKHIKQECIGLLVSRAIFVSIRLSRVS